MDNLLLLDRVRLAWQREASGESLSRVDIDAVAKWDRQQMAKYGPRYLADFSKSKYCQLVGLPRQDTERHFSAINYPGCDRLNLRDVLQAFHASIGGGSKDESLDPNDEDDRRYKAARADIKELERDKLAGELVELSALATVFQRWSARLRAVGTALGRKYGRDAQKLLNDGLDDCVAIIETVVEET